MSNRVRQSRVSVGFPSRLYSVELCGHGFVANRVNVDDQALLVGGDDDLSKARRIDR